MGRILFFHCSRYNNITPIITMGLWGLADLADQLGYKVEIIHTRIEESKSGCFNIKEYLDEDVILAGFSAHWFPMLKECIDLAREVKELYPDIYTYMGGFSASYFCDALMKKYHFIDAIVRGDGEEPLKQLLHFISNKSKGQDMVPNLVWRNPAGKVIFNEFTYVARNEDIEGLNLARFDKYLHDYPFASRSEIFNIKYGEFADFKVMDFKLEKTFYLLTGKGCYTNCLFCGGGINAQRIINGRNHCLFINNKKIVDTIKEAIKLGYRAFYVCFDPLPDKPRYLELLHEIKKEKLDIDLFFGFWKLPTEDIIEEFSNTTKNLLFEISPETIKEENRNKVRGYSFTNEDMFKIINVCFNKKIYLHLYFSYPLPYDSYQDVLSTRKAFWDINTRYPHYIEALYIKLSTDPGAPLYCNPEKYGCKLKVRDFEEHLQLCAENKGGNIMVHGGIYYEDSMQEIFKFIAYDNNIKGIFLYNIKLIRRAFYKIEEFIGFLDNIYIYCEAINKDKSSFKEEDVIAAMLSCLAEGRYPYHKWLNDLLSYLLIEKRLRKISCKKQSKPAREKCKEDLILGLVQEAELFRTDYNVPEACKILISEKKFIEVEKFEESRCYMLVKAQSIEAYEINESMFRLLELYHFNTTLSIADICMTIAGEYSDDLCDREYIKRDLIAMSEKLYQQNLIIQEAG